MGSIGYPGPRGVKVCAIADIQYHSAMKSFPKVFPKLLFFFHFFQGAEGIRGLKGDKGEKVNTAPASFLPTLVDRCHSFENGPIRVVISSQMRLSSNPASGKTLKGPSHWQLNPRATEL